MFTPPAEGEKGSAFMRTPGGDLREFKAGDMMSLPSEIKYSSCS